MEYVKRHSLRALTKENTLVLKTVDIGGKNTQEGDQVRLWAAPTIGPEISTVLEGILGRWGGLWLPAKERTLIAVTQETPYSYVLICSVDSFWFCPFFSSSVVVVNFIGTMKSNYAFELCLFFFFPQSLFIVVNPCPSVGILQLWGVLFSFFSLF